MVAILTKYLRATNASGSRIKAFTESGKSITISFDYALDEYDCHKKAAQALCDKMEWNYNLTGGGIKGGYAFVMTAKEIK